LDKGSSSSSTCGLIACDALPLTAGKGGHLALAKPVEPQHREQLIDARVDLGATDTAQLETVTDVLRDRHMRP
jgi:hypothetical protein